MSRRSLFPRISVSLIAVILFAATCFAPRIRASIFGTVRGIVHDVQHRPIAGALIELRAAQSDWQRTTVSDADGSFQIDAVPAGKYMLRVSLDSFRESLQTILVVA